MFLRVLIAVILIPIICLIIMVSIYLLPLPYALSDNRDLLAAAITGIVMFLYLMAFSFYIVSLVKKAGSKFDAYAIEKGLTAKSLNIFGRSYSGILKEKYIEISYFPRRNIHRASLDIHTEYSSTIRFVISKKKPISYGHSYNRSEIFIAGIPSGYSIFLEENTEKDILSTPKVDSILHSLLGSDKGDLIQIYLGVDEDLGASARIRSYDFPEDVFARYLDLFVEFIKAIE